MKRMKIAYKRPESTLSKHGVDASKKKHEGDVGPIIVHHGARAVY